MYFLILWRRGRGEGGAEGVPLKVTIFKLIPMNFKGEILTVSVTAVLRGDISVTGSTVHYRNAGMPPKVTSTLTGSGKKTQTRCHFLHSTF